MKKEKQIKEKLSNEINPEVQDPLTEVLREGARRMLALAIEAEVEEFINQYHTLKDEGGRRAIVRNGYQKERYSYWIRLNPGISSQGKRSSERSKPTSSVYFEYPP